MKGLIYENFYILKKQFMLSFILLFICGIMSVVISPYIFYAMSTILVSMLPITAMVYENESKLTKVIITMPVDRKDFVKSKYISTFILGIINFIINLLFMLITTRNGLQSLIFSTISFLIGMTVMNIMFPLIFKFGVEKAKFILGCILMSFFTICYILYKFREFLPTISQYYILFAIIFVPAVIFFISYKLSIKFFNETEIN